GSGLLERAEVRADGGRGDGQPDRQPENHGRVSERKEKANSERLLALLQQLPGGVVDRRYVVGIESVPEPEGVGQDRRTDQGGVSRRDRQQRSPAHQVEQPDEAEESSEPSANSHDASFEV